MSRISGNTLNYPATSGILNPANEIGQIFVKNMLNMLKFADNMDVGCFRMCLDPLPKTAMTMMLQNAVHLCKVQRMPNHSSPVPLLGKLMLHS